MIKELLKLSFFSFYDALKDRFKGKETFFGLYMLAFSTFFVDSIVTIVTGVSSIALNRDSSIDVPPSVPIRTQSLTQIG